MTGTLLIPDIVRHGSARWGDRVALEDARDGRQVTYRELLARMNAGAVDLRGRGLSPGHRVVLRMDGSPQWALAFMSILEANCVAVPIPAATPAALVAAIVQHAGAHAVWDEPGSHLALQHREPPVAGWWSARCDPGSSLAVLAFTSGSTAAPRAVPLTHGNLLANVRALGAVRRAADDEAILSVLPPSHLFELTVGQLAPLALGARIVYAGVPLPNRLLDAVRDRGITRALLVPALVEALARAVIDDLIERGCVAADCRGQSAAVLASRLTSLPQAQRAEVVGAVRDRIGATFRSVGIGGAAIAPAWIDLLTAAGVRVDVGYGLTEAGPLVSLGAAHECPVGSVGRPLSGVEVRIDAGGEILVRGESVTRAAGHPTDVSPGAADGWLRTGDLGRIDDGGYLYVTGRLKEAIVSASGETLSPEEIEPHYASPHFAEWCVVPASDADGNDVATLVVVPSASLTGAEVDRIVAALRVAAPARCRVAGVVRHDGPLPRTALGKVQRRRLAVSLAKTTPPGAAFPISSPEVSS